MLARYVQAQRALRPLTDSDNLEKYYDIYNISTEELFEAESGLAEEPPEDQYSLRSLRNIFGRLYSIRKSVLCCLLALSADGGGSDITRWGLAVEEMRDLANVTGASMRRMTNILNEGDGKLYCIHPRERSDVNSNVLILQQMIQQVALLRLRLLHVQSRPAKKIFDSSMGNLTLSLRESAHCTRKCILFVRNLMQILNK